MSETPASKRTQGTTAGLDRHRITSAAVELIDRDGLERFGVRRLAKELDVDPMSIYHHIKGKEALLDAAAATILAEIATDAAAPDEDWEALARRLARAYRDMAFRHPRVFPLLATRPQNSPSALAVVERLMAAMRAARLPDQVVASAPLTLFALLNGYLLAALAEASSPGSAPEIDPQAHPTMAALASAGFNWAAEFDRVLDTAIAGIRERTTDR